MLLASGTIIGCLCMPLLANRIGRRGALAFYFALMTISISSAFGYAFYLPHHALQVFLPCLFFVGLGGGNFSVYWVWMPEQYHTECRGSALAFASCIGRFVAAGATFLVGIGISHFGSIGAPVALTSLAFALGLLVIPFTRETMGQPLPD
jgi:nitrate/nitrite transporter NarK